MTIKNEARTLPMAVVLAGGQGMRLRPLTEFLPKPLLPLGGKTAIARILENLEEEGVKKALILTGYKGEMIRQALGERCGEMELNYLDEQRNLGSAGCVRQALPQLDDEFFVVCSDLYGKRNYGRFYDAFKEKNADAALLITRVKSPGEYGIVVTDASGRVKSFVEKPMWSRVFSDHANCGIYLMKKTTAEAIPEGPCDFGGQFFPDLISAGTPVYAYEDQGLWRDIGDFHAYLACSLAENGGRSIYYGSAQAHETAKIRDSILFDGARVGENSVLDGCILDEGAVVGAGCDLSGGCVLGRGAVVPDGVSLPGGSVISPGETASDRDGSVPRDHRRLFDGSGLIFPGDCPDRTLTSFGEALGTVCGPSARIGVLDDGQNGSKSVGSSILTGICRIARGEYAGWSYPGQAGAAVRREGYVSAVYISGDEDRTFVQLYDRSGLPPSSAFLRKLRDAFSSEDARREENGAQPPSFAAAMREAEVRSNSEKALMDACFAPISGMRVDVASTNAPSAFLRSILLRLGAQVGVKGGRTRVFLNDDGTRAKVEDGSGRLDHWHISALLLKRTLESGARIVALPYRLPRALFDVVSAAGGTPVGFSLTPEGSGEEETRGKAMDLPFLYDGARAALEILALMRREEKDAAGLLETLPDFHVIERSLDCDESEKLELLLGSGCIPAGEGMDKRVGRSRLALRALEKRGIHLQVEAAKEEDCRELLKRAMRDMRK